jgi:hypothetical protein
VQFSLKLLIKAATSLSLLASALRSCKAFAEQVRPAVEQACAQLSPLPPNTHSVDTITGKTNKNDCKKAAML